VVGLNMINGGATGGAMTAAEVADYGATMLSSPYPCAFISYQYDATYLSSADVQAALATLQATAQARTAPICGRPGGSEPPPDPPPPPSAQPVVLTWASPADITYGTALDGTQLNATATTTAGQPVPGTFSYQPAAGTVLGPGDGQTLTVAFTPDDTAGYAPAADTVQITVRYNYAGFLQPVDNPRVVNTAKAGAAIPVRFSLAGDQGLTIFAAGSPAALAITCPKGKTDAIEETVSATTSGLAYEASSARYVYTWKPDASWANSCRSLVVTLKDGTQHTAWFKFSR
jgi:hypothetical protein